MPGVTRLIVVEAVPSAAKVAVPTPPPFAKKSTAPVGLLAPVTFAATVIGVPAAPLPPAVVIVVVVACGVGFPPPPPPPAKLLFPPPHPIRMPAQTRANPTLTYARFAGFRAASSNMAPSKASRAEGDSGMRERGTLGMAKLRFDFTALCTIMEAGAGLSVNVVEPAMPFVRVSEAGCKLHEYPARITP